MLTGTLHDGTRIDPIALCEFEAPGVNYRGEIGPCNSEPRYRVRFSTGEVLNACEEHAQMLWDADEV